MSIMKSLSIALVLGLGLSVDGSPTTRRKGLSELSGQEAQSLELRGSGDVSASPSVVARLTLTSRDRFICAQSRTSRVLARGNKLASAIAKKCLTKWSVHDPGREAC
jgi:hypothetical protein